MPSMWRKAMLYLGLGPDEEYDDYDAALRRRLDRSTASARPARPHPALRPGRRDADEPSAIGAVRADPHRRLATTSALRPIGPDPRPQVVRPIPVASTPSPMSSTPTSFNEAQEVADKFKGNQPVIMNLQGADRDLPAPHRLRQWPLLRRGRADGEGRQPGVPAHAVQRGGVGRGAAPPAGAGILRPVTPLGVLAASARASSGSSSPTCSASTPSRSSRCAC